MQERKTMVGIVGDSGAGKSTYVKGLSSFLGEGKVTIIGLDDYHTLDRAQRKAVGITPLNPRCNDLGLVIDHAWQLRRGEEIEKPVYDHSTGMFAPPEKVTPREYVIMEGLHTLYLELMRAALDLKIYFDTDLELKLRWKIQRDVVERGHSEEQVRKEIEQRQPDIRAFVEPQKRYADVIVNLAPKPGSNDIRVFLFEKPGPNTISARLSQDGWRKRLGLNHSTQTVMGQHFEVTEIPDAIPADTVKPMLSSLGITDLSIPETCDPVTLSQILVVWRIRTSHQYQEVLGNAAQL